jgi:hypothetical protein
MADDQLSGAPDQGTLPARASMGAHDDEGGFQATGQSANGAVGRSLHHLRIPRQAGIKKLVTQSRDLGQKDVMMVFMVNRMVGGGWRMDS